MESGHSSSHTSIFPSPTLQLEGGVEFSSPTSQFSNIPQSDNDLNPAIYDPSSSEEELEVFS